MQFLMNLITAHFQNLHPIKEVDKSTGSFLQDDHFSPKVLAEIIASDFAAKCEVCSGQHHKRNQVSNLNLMEDQ